MNWVDAVWMGNSGGALFLGVFLFLILMTRKGPQAQASRLLGLLILVCALNAAHSQVMRTLGVPVAFSGQLFEPLQFLLPPLWTAYAAALVGDGFRLRWRHLWHLAPVLAAGAASFVFTFEDRAGVLVSAVFWGALTLQMAVYLLPASRLIHRYQASLTDRVSNLARVDLEWLRWFSVVALVLSGVSLTVLVLLLHNLEPVSLGPWISLIMTAAVWVLGYRGLQQQRPDAPNAEAASEGSAKPPLTAGEAQRLGNAVQNAFATQKLHLDPDLGLSDLARLVGVPRNQLSYAINQSLGMNFYDLVNGWRVKEFRALATEPARRGDKMLTLAFDAGFNSKPTFNKVVRQLTGKTPSQVRSEAEIESQPTR